MECSERIQYARQALLGVSIGDAFGESFFGAREQVIESIRHKKVPDTKWEFTDDTVMSIAILEELEKDGDIDQDSLIRKFCTNHELDANRGYGATLRKLLREVNEGENWRAVSKSAFDGQGSMGNGAAMRVCPIGAFYYDNSQKVKELAIKSAETTHANIEAIAGAVAIGAGTALATKNRIESLLLQPEDFIDSILNELPDCDTKSKIARSKSVAYTFSIETVRSILGDGTKMLAQDTVPFSIWCAAYNLNNFEEALWKAVSILGDRDTICAMVGGMTIMSSCREYIPSAWISSVEKFEESIFRNKK